MGSAERVSLLEECAQQRHSGGVAESPSEFLEVHGKHVYAFFLARYGDAASVLSDAYKRSGLDVVVSVVGNEVFYCLSRFWTHLHFIEYYQGLAFFQRNVVDGLQLQKQEVEIH